MPHIFPFQRASIAYIKYLLPRFEQYQQLVCLQCQYDKDNELCKLQSEVFTVSYLEVQNNELFLARPLTLTYLKTFLPSGISFLSSWMFVLHIHFVRLEISGPKSTNLRNVKAKVSLHLIQHHAITVYEGANKHDSVYIKYLLYFL